MRKLMRNRKAMAWVVLLTFLFTSIVPTGTAFAATADAQIVNAGGTNYYKADGTPVTDEEIAAGATYDVALSKTIEETGIENVFDITLAVENAIGDITTNYYYDSAVVLTIDASVSMTLDYNKINDKTRLEIAKETACEFVDKYGEIGADSGAKRMLAVVKFGYHANRVQEWIDVSIEDNRTTVKNAINGIGESGATNFEGAAFLAGNQFVLNGNPVDAVEDIEHRYAIFLSDGGPTTGYDNSRYSEFNQSLTGPITHRGVSDWTSKLSYGGYYQANGVDYDEVQQFLARIVNADQGNAKLYLLGLGLSGEQVEWCTLDNSNWRYINGRLYNSIDFLNEMATATGGTAYPNMANKADMEAVYTSITNEIKNEVKTEASTGWFAIDPVGGQDTPYVEFVGFHGKDSIKEALTNDPDGDKASYNGTQIDWDLKESTCDSNNVYQIKYRVRLANEDNNFVANNEYFTNGTANFTWQPVTSEGFGTPVTKDFPVPSVQGYLADLTFKKVDSNTNEGIAGAKFTLTHADDCTVCEAAGQNVTITQKKAISDGEGTVTFNSVPSGHNYVLTETKAPAGYNIVGGPWNVNVAYGQITVDGNEVPDTIINTPETVNISGEKIWVDDDNKDGKRPESITVRLEGVESNYTTSQVITLADDWKYAFADLPKYHNGQKVNYIITEDKVEGYQTLYDVDSYDIINIQDDHASLFIDLPVTKVWDDDDNALNKRPESILLQLKVNGVTTGSAIELETNGTDTWEYTFEKLPKYDADGKTNVYTVEELNVPEGYVSAAVATMNGVNITNKLYAGDEGEFSVSKKVEGEKAPADDTVYDFELEVTAEHQDWSAVLVHNRNELKAENEKALAAQVEAQNALDEAAALFKANAKVYSTGSAYKFVMRADSTSPAVYRYTFIENGTAFAKTTESAYSFDLANPVEDEDNILDTIVDGIKALASEFATVANPVNFLNALQENVGLADNTAVAFEENDAAVLLTAADRLFDADRQVEATSSAMLEFEANVPTTTSAITLVMTPKDGAEETLNLLPEDAVNGVYIIPFSLTKDMDYNFAIKATTGTSIQYVVKEVGYPTADYLYTLINGVEDTDRATEMIALANNSVHSHYMFTNVYDKNTTPPGDPWTPPYVPPTDPTDPPVVIDDPETPLADVPEEDVEIVEPGVPLGDAPEEEIFEEEIPLGDAPPTGDTNNAIPFVVLMMAAVAGMVITRKRFN